MVGIHRSTRPCTWWTLGSFFCPKKSQLFFLLGGGGGGCAFGQKNWGFFLIKPHKIQHLYMIFFWLMIYEIDIWEHQSQALKKTCLSPKIFFHWNIWWWLEPQVAKKRLRRVQRSSWAWIPKRWWRCFSSLMVLKICEMTNPGVILLFSREDVIYTDVHI